MKYIIVRINRTFYVALVCGLFGFLTTSAFAGSFVYRLVRGNSPDNPVIYKYELNGTESYVRPRFASLETGTGKSDAYTKDTSGLSSTILISEGKPEPIICSNVLESKVTYYGNYYDKWTFVFQAPDLNKRQRVRF